MTLPAGRTAFCAFVGALSVLCVGDPWPVHAAKRRDDEARTERLARIYVFYSEPPFAYTPGEEIRIRLYTRWDRERMEREIRESVDRKGADLVILQRSFMEYDGPATVVTDPRSGEVQRMLVPNQSAYVEGRLARRLEDSPAGERERVYPVDFETAWKLAGSATRAMRWRLDVQDTDSRYLTTQPAPAGAGAMPCDSEAPGQPLAAATVVIRSYSDLSIVRLDVKAVDATTGEPAACRSNGVLEKAFFEALERHLSEAAEPTGGNRN